jgi:IMP cyclohydrolase
MASGRLGAADLASTYALNTVYQCPVTTYAIVSVSFCNRTASPMKFRLAVATSDSPTNSEYIEYEVSVSANGVLERQGIVLAAGERIVAGAELAGASVVVFGVETSTV